MFQLAPILGFFDRLENSSKALEGGFEDAAAVVVFAGLVLGLSRSFADVQRWLSLIVSAIIVVIVAFHLESWSRQFDKHFSAYVENALSVDVSETFTNVKQAFAGKPIGEGAEKASLYELLIKGKLGEVLLSLVALLVSFFVQGAVKGILFLKELFLFAAYLTAPLMISFFMLPAMVPVARVFVVSLLSILLWDLGFAFASLGTDVLLLQIQANNFGFQTVVNSFQNIFYALVLSAWIFFSYLSFPFFISAALLSGKNLASAIIGAAISSLGGIASLALGLGGELLNAHIIRRSRGGRGGGDGNGGGPSSASTPEEDSKEAPHAPKPPKLLSGPKKRHACQRVVLRGSRARSSPHL